MKKLLAIILALVFVFAFAACGEDKTNSNDGSIVDGSSEIEVSSEEAKNDLSSNTNSIVSDTSSKAPSNNSSTQKPTVSQNPVNSTYLNPKKEFKYGTYEASFFDGNKYTNCSLNFDKEYESLLFNFTTYYNKEGAIAKMNEFGSTFNEADYRKITVNGVDYFDLEFNWGSLPMAFEFTEKNIRISSDYENFTLFTLLPNGNLKQENNPDNSFAKVGTIFTYKG